MTATLNFIPALVPLRSPIGASVAIRLRAKHSDGTPFDLTPYTLTAPFTPQQAPPAVAAWTITSDAADVSAVVLSLTDEQTAALAPQARPVTWHWVVWLDDPASGSRLLFSHGDLGLVTP